MNFQNPGLGYGLYAAGLAVFGILYALSLKKAGLKWLCAPVAALFGLILAVVGARLFYLVPNKIFNGGPDPESLFSLRPDELSFTGGCAGFVLGAVLAAKVCRVGTREALDAMALPGCVLIAFARLAETGIGFINTGEMPSFLPAVWPFAVFNGWGLPDLSVSTLMALAALLCALWLGLTGRRPAAPGFRFETAVWVLCSVQLFLEMLCTTSSWIPFIISFIHLEQVLCAVILLVMMIRRTVRDKKAGPLIATVLLLGLNALMQFVQDKPYLFPLPEGTNIATVAIIVFALTSAGLIAVWLRGGRAQSVSVKGS